MDLKEWADRLNGREYGRGRFTAAQERAQAKAEGVVIVYGASDDLMEFEGAIDDELGANNGTTAYITSEGLFDLNHACPEGGHNTIDDCHYLRAERDACIKLNAIWEPRLMDGASWLIEAPESLPHEHFDIMEDGEIFCRGLVFRLADVKAPDSLEKRVRALAAAWRAYGKEDLAERFAWELELVLGGKTAQEARDANDEGAPE